MFKITRNNILVVQWVTALTLYPDFYSIEQVPEMLGLRETVLEVLNEAKEEVTEEK